MSSNQIKNYHNAFHDVMYDENELKTSFTMLQLMICKNRLIENEIVELRKS